MKKKCNRCKKDRDIGRYSSNPNTVDKLAVECKDCDSDRHYERNDKKNDHIYKAYYKWKYKLDTILNTI